MLVGLVLFGCAPAPVQETAETLEPLPAVASRGAGTARNGGRLGGIGVVPPSIVDQGAAAAVAAGNPAEAGDISLAFVDSDLREVVEQVLGTILGVNYTIDPAVRGMVTLRTPRPVNRAQAFSALQAVLAQNGATIAVADGLYRVSPAGGAQAGAAGSVVVPLRFAAAEDLAKVLTPFVGQGGRIAADPGRNALIVASDADTREALVAMIRGFDTDVLAGQSYALFPVVSGGVKEFAGALQEAFRGQGGGALAGAVRVVPMERVNAVMVVAAQPRFVEEARRIYTMVDRARRQTVRSWHITYLQNSDSSDVAFVLQSALTPNNVTAQPRGSQGGAGGGRDGGRVVHARADV